MSLRSILRTLCLAALVSVAGCESTTGTPAHQGRFSFVWGGERFEGDAVAGVYGDSLYIRGGSPGGVMSVLEVNLAIGGFDGPGEYPLRSAGGVIHYLVGGDAITGTYSTPATEAGTLVITTVRGETITGHVEFDAAAHSGYAPAGARARFEGEFEAKVDRPQS